MGSNPTPSAAAAPNVYCPAPVMFDNLGYFHPIVVHFPIALTYVGVGARLLWLLFKRDWLSHAATALLAAAALAAFVAAFTGERAQPPVEEVPGSHDAAEEHEDWGKRSRNLLIGIALVELGALAVSGKRQTILRYVSAAAGLVAMFFMFETGEHGGELVYSYAGGVGIRTGENEDVERLLLAGLYHQAPRDRAAGRSEDAANLIRELARRFPNDSSVRLLAIESMIREAKNPVGALTALDTIHPPKTSRALYLNAAILRADALNATGQRDSARTVLNALTSDFPTSARLRAKLDSLR
ncbi:MAG: DUF2231 domain-containing protein [Gemmatimonadaceae bacterium]